MSVQSSKKQKEGSCMGHQHGPYNEACASFSEHGCGAWAVKQRCAHQFIAAWVSSHGPCSSSSAHGSSTRGVSVRRANPFFRTRGVLRLSTDRAERVLHGSRLALHGACFSGSHSACFSSSHRACKSARVTFASARVKLILHGACNFPSSEVGSPNFSQ